MCPLLFHNQWRHLHEHKKPGYRQRSAHGVKNTAAWSVIYLFVVRAFKVKGGVRKEPLLLASSQWEYRRVLTLGCESWLPRETETISVCVIFKSDLKWCKDALLSLILLHCSNSNTDEHLLIASLHLHIHVKQFRCRGYRCVRRFWKRGKGRQRYQWDTVVWSAPKFGCCKDNVDIGLIQLLVIVRKSLWLKILK